MSFILLVLYFVLIFGSIYLVWAISRINSRVKKVQWMNSQEYTLLRIDVPRQNEKTPQSAEQMFATIHGIYSETAKYQYHLSFEIVSREKYIQFFVYLPAHLKDFVQGQVYAQYPNVEIHEVADYTQDSNIVEKNYAIAEFKLNKPDVYPIKQFTDFDVDPISAITSVMSQLNSGEEIWFQMIVRPVGDTWQEKGHSRVSSVRNGTKMSSGGIGGAILSEISSIGKGFLSQAVNPGATVEKKEIKLHASVEEALKGIEQKITKLGFETKIRVLALSSDSISARDKCRNVCAAFKQFNTTNLNGFKIGEIETNNHERLRDFVERSFENDGNIFNIAELASLYHFPSKTVETPNIVWSGSRKGEPPANLPLRENVDEKDFTVVGQTNFRNNFTEFGIKRDDRRRHIYIVGKSGVGKSVLIENMAINDVYKGSGIIIVDPHGELAEKVLSCIPENRVNDVIVFDPSDKEFPIAFNILEAVDEDFKGLVASGFIGIFKKIFGQSWGPRLEHILRNTVLALLDNPGSTMLDIPRMLTNARFRDKVLENVKDTVIKEFWLNEFASFDSKFRTEAVAPILNKVGQFLASSTIRNIVGQSKSTIDIREIMDQEKIMIVNLSRGKIGEDNSALLGAMMITKIQLAAMSRANVTIDKRPDCFLYVDEFQNFATDAFAVILSEARKYNLGLTMAHQYITQLPEELRNAIFGNAGTLISFRVGGADADVLVKEFEPVFTANDLVNLEKYNIYIKLLVDGVSAPAFSAKTLPPVQKLTGNLEKVIDYSRKTYTSPRSQVEDVINNRSAREEDELKAEAEAFKKGGLEALLVKKHDTNPQHTEQQQSAPQHHSPAPSTAPIQTKPVEDKSVSVAEPVNRVDEEKPATVVSAPIISQADGVVVGASLPQDNSNSVLGNTEALPDTPAPKREPKIIRYQNILDGKIYKERTARGGVKWYLGEEINEEKLAKSGTLINDEGRELIDLSKKVSNNKPNHEAKHHSEHKESHNNQSDMKHGDHEAKIGDRPEVGEQEKPAEKTIPIIESTQTQALTVAPLEIEVSNNIPTIDHVGIPTESVGEIIEATPLSEKREELLENNQVVQQSTQTNQVQVPQHTTSQQVSEPVGQKVDQPVHQDLEEGKEVTFDDL